MQLSVPRLAPLFGRRRAVPPTRRMRARARLALASAPPALVLVLWAAWLITDPGASEPVDAEYRARLTIARAARAEHPDRPLGLVIGSSRTMAALQPELLPATDGVYWVNAARAGAGPVFNRVLLNRFLRDGVRPAVVAFEVLPLFFTVEESEVLLGYLGPKDLWVHHRDLALPFESDSFILRSRFKRLIGEPPVPVVDCTRAYRSRGGYPELEDDITPADRARRTEFGRVRMEHALRTVSVRPGADRAFRASVRAATASGARVVLFRAPEGPAFRSWYDPSALARFDDYVARVAAEHGVPVVDARLWLEEEDFTDSHHALRRGAEKFTARFAREAASALAGPEPK